MVPVRVAAPVSDPVSLDAVKDHLRVDANDTSQDTQLAALIDAAVAHLDGWSGVLGRCIMEQTWAVTVEGAGTYTLPFPDVTEATTDYGDGTVNLEITPSAAGPQVTVTDAATIEFTCQMPIFLRPVAASAVKLLVERDFDRPSGPDYDALSRSVDALVGAIRWRRA